MMVGNIKYLLSRIKFLGGLVAEYEVCLLAALLEHEAFKETVERYFNDAGYKKAEDALRAYTDNGGQEMGTEFP